jgi:DNA-binding transcriptional ArsR family regulator
LEDLVLPRDKSAGTIAACPPKPALKRRPPLTRSQAVELESVFKVLGNATRLRLLHTLVRKEEPCVTDLADAVGMSPQAVSNQLQRLADRGILGTRRDGNRIHYRVVDRCVVELLNLGLCLTEDSKKRTR